jgi:BMFP domain-containing protein YqiC
VIATGGAFGPRFRVRTRVSDVAPHPADSYLVTLNRAVRPPNGSRPIRETTMPPSNRLFDDLARLMTDAAGAAQGVRREAETVVKAQVERLVRDLDIASREELDVLRDMVTNLRAQNEALTARVAALETREGSAGAGAAGLSEVV